eukprot:CAMPEP_0204285324 /NCGR_PEP_ID=MMETSP0468-20130131/50381_1 /ASSEMBLY_ACC=CAM_ASM_000383 /TAXON_ID=2969 /ORGANISM="Oxyrrhis marina" /LENGTH=30 /DNA_ID= /DNA_START= /DNA_END= /DNA_ORIENTATION=
MTSALKSCTTGSSAVSSGSPDACSPATTAP